MYLKELPPPRLGLICDVPSFNTVRQLFHAVFGNGYHRTLNILKRKPNRVIFDCLLRLRKRPGYIDEGWVNYCVLSRFNDWRNSINEIAKIDFPNMMETHIFDVKGWNFLNQVASFFTLRRSERFLPLYDHNVVTTSDRLYTLHRVLALILRWFMQPTWKVNVPEFEHALGRLVDSLYDLKSESTP